MLSGEATNTNFIVFGLTRWRWKPRIYSTRGEHSNHYTTDGDANPGSTAPEASTLTITPPMVRETQDLQHQRRWKPRIYNTRGEHPNHYTTATQGLQRQRRWNPGFTAPEASTLTITPLKPRIYSTRDEHSNHYTTDGDGIPGSTAPEATTLSITPPMAMETQYLQHQRRAL